MAQIRCSDLTLAYDGAIAAHGVDFTVNTGDYLCIVGENGSGKSTLVRALLGLKSPSSGSITFGDGLTAKEIGYLPQQTEIQRDFPASVREVVLSGCVGRFGHSLFYTKLQKDLAAYHMERMGISNLAKKCYRELSGGQQQRVRLARALCATGKLLLLDEPTAGLDPLVSRELYTLIEHLHKTERITIVMVSHDTGVPLHDATHVLHLKNKQLFFGTREEYLASEIGKAFLGGGEHD